MKTETVPGPWLPLSAFVVLLLLFPALHGSRADDTIEVVVLQPDGKIIAAGESGRDFGLARYHADGSPDRSFDGDGKVTTDFGGFDGARAAAVQSDGKVIVAGFTADRTGQSDFAVVRFHSDGHVDSSFGAGGLVTVDFSGNRDEACCVAIQTDDRIVVAGLADADAERGDFGLVRLLPDGGLDPDFGAGGLVTTRLGADVDRAGKIAFQPDGKILVGGGSGVERVDTDVALVRYLANGELDSGFGTGGVVLTDFGGIDSSADLSVLPDGKVIAAGSRASPHDWPPDEQIVLARYLPDGKLDPGFGTGGKVIGSKGKSLRVFPQANGELLVAGSFIRREFLVFHDFLELRFDSAGNEIGHGRETGGDFSEIAGAVQQPDGKLIVAVRRLDPFSGGTDFHVSRFLSDAVRDPSFGTFGEVTTDLDRYQVDNLIGRRGNRKLGRAVYNRTGAGQEIRLAGRTGERARFFVFVRNGGTATDSALVRGTPGDRKCRVKYVQINRRTPNSKARLTPPYFPPKPSRLNVTAEMTGRGLELLGGFYSGNGRPRIEVSASVGRGRGRPPIKSLKIVSESLSDPSKYDAVRGTIFFRK